MVYNEVLVLKKSKNAISKLENILEYSPKDALEINYFIAKTCIENNTDLSKGKKSLDYCNNHFIENRYFTKDDLQKLENK